MAGTTETSGEYLAQWIGDLIDVGEIANATGASVTIDQRGHVFHYYRPDSFARLVFPLNRQEIPYVETSVIGVDRRNELYGFGIAIKRGESVTLVKPDLNVGVQTASGLTISRYMGIEFFDNSPIHEITDEGIREAVSIATHRELAAQVKFDYHMATFAAERGITLPASAFREDLRGQ